VAVSSLTSQDSESVAGRGGSPEIMGRRQADLNAIVYADFHSV
jgi:hypothetical protein